MTQFLVTIKYPKNINHDSKNKKTGTCPANPHGMCSDVTGEHHTLLWEGDSLAEAETHFRGMGLHVTRVEEV